MKRNFSQFKNKVTKACPRCKGELLVNKIIKTPLYTVKDVIGKDSAQFYGGNVKRFSLTACPHCEAEILLYLKSIGSSWIIHDVAIEEGVLTEKPKVQDNKDSVVEPKATDVGDAEALERALAQVIDTEVTNEKLDADHRLDLLNAISNRDLDLALLAADNISFGMLPKTLIEAGFSSDIIYTSKGKNQKKVLYMKLITDHINKELESNQ